MAKTSYAIGLGSNRYRSRSPKATVACAIDALADAGATIVLARSPIVVTAPLGPGTRRYANAAALIETTLPPRELFELVQSIEARFGRRRARRWGDRTLDMDLLLWSGGIWCDDRLTLPHPAFRGRTFVLGPLAAIAPGWIDPLTGLSIRQLLTRLHRPIPVDHSRPRP